MDGRLMADGSSYGQKPAKKLSKTEAADIIAEARDRLQLAWEADRRNREEAAIDLRFIAGDQWPDAVKTERTADGRPMITVNRLPQFLRQVTNPIREADLSIKTAPVDSKSDPKVAKVYDGLLKQIQYQSSARAVYATCSEHQTGCGIGWARVCTEHVDDTTFDQELRIKAIPNPLAVYDDPGAVEPDRCDSNWRFITQMMPLADFKARWPKADVAGVDKPSDGLEGMYWQTDDKVRIAEYWKKVPVKKTLLQIGEQTVDADKFMQLAPDMQAMLQMQITRTREVDCYEVKQYLISGNDVLDGPNDWPGKYLPQVPFIGSEVPVESGTYRYGLIRFARDPQALYNYYRTATAESIALAPKAPYLLTPKMIGSYQEQWNSANRKNRPYLLYNPDDKAPGMKPQREHPPEHPAALVNETQMAAEDMKGVTGIYDASLGGQSNETSGIAIGRRQMQGDTANYHYGDNCQRSLEYLGRVLIDLIAKIYDNERIIRILGDDDQEELVEINKFVATDPETGYAVLMNDLSAGRFDVRVRIGKSADSKRLETVDALMSFIKAFPSTEPFIADLVAKNLDTPGSEEMAKRLRNMVPPQALADPDDPEAPQPPDPMQDPVVQLELGEKQSKIEKTQAETRKIQLEADALEFNTVLDVDQAQQGQHPKQMEARNAALSADDQELSNTLNRDQAQRGEHEKQKPYADLSRQLEEAMAAKKQQPRVMH
jgi:hypothetical protein